MDTSTVIALAVAAFVVLAGIMLIAASRRGDTTKAIGVLSRETRARDEAASPSRTEGKASPSGKELELAAEVERRQASKELVTGGSSAPVEWVAPDPQALGATRRAFLNRSIVSFFGLSLSGFGAACIAFLWPGESTGFGSAIRVGEVSEIIADIKANNGFLYRPGGRMWITEYPAEALEKARTVYSPPELTGMEAGVIALYQKCVHLGCRVPSCPTSQWFECGCHGSQYNQVGEKKGGPAPRGLDRFAMTVADGALTVDTGTIILGPPIGTNTTGQEAEGPHCVGSASH